MYSNGGANIDPRARQAQQLASQQLGVRGSTGPVTSLEFHPSPRPATPPLMGPVDRDSTLSARMESAEHQIKATVDAVQRHVDRNDEEQAVLRARIARLEAILGVVD